tara:strand:- start:40 stop:4962 length:4923 start_codon:yes stop_codon:yes gene_type:complete
MAEQTLTDGNNQPIAKDDSAVKGKILVGNPAEGFRWVDESQYNMTGAVEGLPVESSTITSSLNQKYVPPVDIYGEPNVALQRAQQYAASNPEQGTAMFSAPAVQEKMRIQIQERDKEIETTESFVESLTRKRDYEIFMPDDVEDNFLKDADGKIRYKTVTIKHPWKPGKESTVSEPIYKRVVFRNFVGSAGGADEGMPEGFTSPEKGEDIVLDGVTKSEAQRAAFLYTDIIKKTGMTRPPWARGRWWERIPGYTEEGVGSMSNTSGEDLSVIEALYGTPIIGDVVTGITAIPRILSDKGTTNLLTYAMNKEKEFTDWLRTGGDEEGYYQDQLASNKKFKWSRKLTARQVKYMLDKPEAEGLDKYVHLLGENVAFTLGALRATRFIGKSKGYFKKVNDQVFKNYETKIIADLKKNNITPTRKRIDAELDKISATQFQVDANSHIKRTVMGELDAKKLSGLQKLDLFYKNAKYKTGARPGIFARDTVLQEGTFTYGQLWGQDISGDDSFFTPMGLGLGFAVATPSVLNIAIRTGQFIGLLGIDVIDDGLSLLGTHWEFGNKMAKAISESGDSGFLQNLLVQKKITSKQYKSGLKFFTALQDMPVQFRDKAIQSLKNTSKIKQELDGIVRSLSTQGLDGKPLKVGQSLKDSKFSQQFKIDPNLSDEVNLDNVLKSFNQSLGQSLELKLMTQAEAGLIQQTEAGLTLDYNFLMAAKLQEDKFITATNLNKLLDSLNAVYPKNLVSKELESFMKEAKTQINSVMGESAENIKIIKNVGAHALATAILNNSTDVARLDALVDNYASLEILELKMGGATIEDIAKVQKEASRDKYIIRRDIIAKEMKATHSKDANIFTASESSGALYVNSWEDIKSIASKKYDAAFEGIDDAISEDAYPLLKELVEETKASPSELFTGEAATDVGAVLNRIIDPVVNKRMGQFYSTLVGKEIDGLTFKNADEVKNFFETEIFPDLGAYSGLQKFEKVKEKLPAILDELGIDIGEFGLQLRMDDFDNLVQGINSRIYSKIGSNSYISSDPATTNQVRKLVSIKSILDQRLTDGENFIKTEYKNNWKLYQEAKAFYADNAVAVLYQNDFTDWVMKVDSPGKGKVSANNPTGYKHSNSLKGSGTKDGFLDYVWKSFQEDPDRAMKNVNKTFGVWDGVKGSDNFIPVTDEMITKAEMGSSGFNADELRTIKLRRETFSSNLMDYYVGKFQDNVAKAGEQAGIPRSELKRVALIDELTGKKTGETVIDWDHYIDAIDSVRAGDESADIVYLGLKAQRQLFTDAKVLDDMNSDIFNSTNALQLRKKLDAVDFKNKQITKKLKDSDQAIKQSQKNLTNVETIVRHQGIIEKAVQDITGGAGNVDNLFDYFIEAAPGADRIQKLKDFLVFGKVSEEIRIPIGPRGTKTIGKDYKTLTGGKMTEKAFDAAMSKIIAAGIRRASTSQISKANNVNIGIGRIRRQDSNLQTVTDHVAMMRILEENEKALSPYINMKAMKVIASMGLVLDPTATSGGINLASSGGLAKFTPASWISRFYAAQSGRTSYRYIGAEAMVAALLRNRHSVTLALLENKGAQEALAEMLITGRVPHQMIGHATYAWLPDLVARSAQITDIGDTIYTKAVEAEDYRGSRTNPTEEQMRDLRMLN